MHCESYIGIFGGLVFDGSGAEPTALDVEISSGRVTRISNKIEGGDYRIDLSGKALIPGLIDTHVHAGLSTTDALSRQQMPFSYQFHETAKNLALMLDCGITTARDAGGTDLGTAKAISDRLIDGPDLRIAISMLSQTGGHSDGWNVDGATCAPLFPKHPGRPSGVVDGPDQIRLRVRELIRAGADVIKICTTGGVSSERDNPRHAQFTMEEVRAAVAEAGAAELSVMAHAQGRTGIINAIQAGVKSIEHGIYADEECFSLMKEHGVWLVPTLSAPYQVLADHSAGRMQLSDQVLEKYNEVAEIHVRMFQRAVVSGVRIAMGTDSGVFPHGRNLDELTLMQRGGMMPAAVLRSATLEGAQLLGLHDRGRVAEGLRSDLVVVSGDPLNFENYRDRIVAVWKEGAQLR